MYAVGFTGGPEEVAEQAQARLDQGYAAIKLRVGFGLKRDIALVSTVRAALGEDAEILLDANMGWSREEASEAVAALAEFRPGWLEEPLAHTDVEGLAALRRGAPMPIAAGENAYGALELRALLDADAVDVIMPDLARCGGFLVGLDAARLAVSRGVRVSPHHYASDVGFSADVALCSVIDEGLLIRDVSEWPIREELVGGAFDLSTGSVAPYAGPGLSPQPSSAVVERWRLTDDRA